VKAMSEHGVPKRARRGGPMGQVIPLPQRRFALDELVFAAVVRCRCGTGMAYPKGIGPQGKWNCADVLLGNAATSGHDEYPFFSYEIKSELQPSQQGATTRPR